MIDVFILLLAWPFRVRSVYDDLKQHSITQNYFSKLAFLQYLHFSIVAAHTKLMCDLFLIATYGLHGVFSHGVYGNILKCDECV